MKLIDSHCHLQDEKLIGSIEAVIADAKKSGVEYFASCGTCPSDWQTLKRLFSEHREIIPFYGVHPWFIPAGDPSEWLPELEKLIADNPIANVGEIGLDHALTERNDELQHRVFELQLDMSVRLNRPSAIHCRKAWGTLLDILSRKEHIPAGFMIHSFSGSKEMLDPIIKANGYVSFSGSITRSGNKRAHEAARIIPLDRLLVETDSPDIPPVINGSDPGKDYINTPANLTLIISKIASLRNMPQEELADITYANSKRLFRL